ncbi:MAG: hypothetical protein R2941_15395 [Desulfobacterales bacterium]
MVPMTLHNLEAVREECRAMVNKRAIVSGAASLVPVPGMDIAADVGMLMELLPAISRKFGLAKEQIDDYDYQMKMFIFNLIRSAGTEFAGRVITKELIIAAMKRIGLRITAKQIAKYIPIIGQACAVSVSIAAMRYVGNSHVDDCHAIAKQIVGTRALRADWQ